MLRLIAAGGTVVVLEPEAATVFPESGEVNAGLRALAGIIHEHRTKRTGPHRSA
jgi:hypothetical protein